MGLHMNKFLAVGFAAALGSIALLSQAKAETRQAFGDYCQQNPNSPNCGAGEPNGANSPPPGFPHPPRPPFHPPGHQYGGDGQNWGGDGNGQGWRHHPRQGIYFNFQVDPSYDGYGDNYDNQNYDNRCSRIAQSLRYSGYRHVRALACGGRNFVYSAYRDGEQLRLTVSRRSGRIVNIRPIY